METAEYALMDAAEERMWWYRALHARLLDALAAHARLGAESAAGLHVLDAGCGTGGFLAALGRRHPGWRATGLEYAWPAARRAAEKAGAPVARGSVNALPFADAAFDAVVSADVLCHAAVDPHAALAELRRVLRPGGRLVLNMPAFAWMLSAHDRRVHNARRVTAGGLRAWLEAAGFRAVRARYWNGLLFPLMVAQRRILAARHDSASDVAPFPPWLDATLHAVTELERRAGRALPLPAGGSVLAVATRP